MRQPDDAIPHDGPEDAPSVYGLAGAVECVLFTADRPVSLEQLSDLLGVAADRVREAVEEVRRRLAGSGLQVQAVAGGFQMATRPEYAEVVRRFLQREHGASLTRGALETLAIVAYRQPITRGEIEQIRGVRSDWHLERLLERQLIRVTGRRETIGRPVLFGTTELFLRYFGLHDLADMPPLGGRGVQALMDAVR